MKQKPMRILFLSSMPPTHSAGLGNDIRASLQARGHRVDMISLYGDEKSDYTYLFTVRRSDALMERLRRFLTRLGVRDRIRKIVRAVIPAKGGVTEANGISIMYPDESRPDVSPETLLAAIPDKQYDAVITCYWQGMLNTTSLRAVHDRLRCPVLMFSPDMAPMTGGCYYFGRCERYKEQCGRCPGLNSSDPDDATHRNYLEKKENYAAMDVRFLGNTWMAEAAEASGIFKPGDVCNVGIVINENTFTPSNQLHARRRLGIPTQKTDVVLARSLKAQRKGCNFVIDACREFLRRHPDRRDSFLLLSVGEEFLMHECRKADIPCKALGIVDRETLIDAYRASTCFMSPSIDDAGPSMVNQAMLCGTPVVCFNTGVAVDVVRDGETGFKSDSIDSASISDRLERMLLSDEDTRAAMRLQCRETGEAHNSYEAFATAVERIVAAR